MCVFGMCHSSRNQTVEITQKFAKDTAFVKDDLKDLPLLLFENKNSEKDYFVILISGDGGWRGFIDIVAKTISEHGPSVVGLNLVGYLNQEKTPEQISRDIQRIIRNFSHLWNKKKVVIGGYSFGGEIIPFFYNKMTYEEQNNIQKIFFIAISNAADFKVSPIYYYNPKKSKPVLPQLQNIEPNKMIFFCDNSNENICKSITDQNKYKLIQLNYSHLFLGHFKEVATIVSQNIVN